MVRGLLQDKKVPGTSAGTRAIEAPGPRPQGLPQDYWERAELTAPSPAEQGLNSTERDWLLEVTGRGRRTKCGKHMERISKNYRETTMNSLQTIST